MSAEEEPLTTTAEDKLGLRRCSTLKPVQWVADGTVVWLPWNRRRELALRCTVACAAGNLARVVNTTFNVDKWVRVDDLLTGD